MPGKMAAWSNILREASTKILPFTSLFRTQLLKKQLTNGQRRCMSEDRSFVITPSKWQWHKTKDWLHFYVMLGVIPLTILITCVNVFIGPATLEPIPEGYVPKYWEYERHPVKRFFLRYLSTSPQQEYEKYLNLVYIEQDAADVRRLERKIKLLMRERQDYRAWYFRPLFGAKYVYLYRKWNDEIDDGGY